MKFSGLGLRVVSALTGLAILLTVGWAFSAKGLAIVVALCVPLILREYERLVFTPIQAPFNIRALFIAIAALLFVGLNFSGVPGLLVYSLCTSLFLAIGIWITRNRITNERLLVALAMGTVGLLYAVVLPSFAIFTLSEAHGLHWFALHLLVVFAGDVAAYFGGIRFGKKKLMPEISPKKTVEGSFSGLLGSTVIGVAYGALVIPHFPIWLAVTFSLSCGFVAQMGDLLASILKRVAQIKDSGQLMPGHGGIIDRIDGVLITYPLIYALALYGEIYWR